MICLSPLQGLLIIFSCFPISPSHKFGCPCIIPIQHTSTLYFHPTNCSASLHISKINPWIKIHVRYFSAYSYCGNALLCRRNHSFQPVGPSCPIPWLWISVPPHMWHQKFQPHFSCFGAMSHAVDHALRNAPPNKPHPPWLQQLQAQWRATRQAFGSIRASESEVASTNDSIGHKALRRKSSMRSLIAALYETKNALFAVMGLLPRKHVTELDDSWLKNSFLFSIEEAGEQFTNNTI
jgi:hypothetical protein